MTIFLTGGSASGKSDWAEGLAVALRQWGRGPLFYLATMAAEDGENLRRVARHRERRAGKGFATIERPADLACLTIPDGAVVLLEDLGNLATNELYSPDGGGETALLGKEYVLCREVGCGVVPLSPEERRWREEVDRLCCRLAREADGMVRLWCGIPDWLKGGDDGCRR